MKHQHPSRKWTNSASPLVVAGLLLPSLHAAVVTSAVSGSWNDPATWDNAGIPAAENDYVIGNGHVVRSPDAGASAVNYAFEGNSLTVASGGVLEFYRNNAGGTFGYQAAIPQLTVAGGTIRTHVGFATSHVTLDSGVEFEGGGTIALGVNYGTYSHNFTLNGAITGNGDVAVYRTAQGTGRGIIFNGSVEEFAGNWSFSGSESSAEVLAVTFAATTSGWGSGELATNPYVHLTINASFASIDGLLAFATTGSTLHLGGDFTIGGLSIDGNALAEGTYSSEDLAALGYGGTYTGAGSVTVVPEPSAAVLSLVTALGLLRRRR